MFANSQMPNIPQNLEQFKAKLTKLGVDWDEKLIEEYKKLADTTVLGSLRNEITPKEYQKELDKIPTRLENYIQTVFKAIDISKIQGITWSASKIVETMSLSSSLRLGALPESFGSEYLANLENILQGGNPRATTGSINLSQTGNQADQLQLVKVLNILYPNSVILQTMLANLERSISKNISYQQAGAKNFKEWDDTRDEDSLIMKLYKNHLLNPTFVAMRENARKQV